MTNGPKQEIQWQIGFSTTNTVANEHKMTDNIVQKAHIYTHSKYSSTKHVENMKNIYNQLY